MLGRTALFFLTLPVFAQIPFTEFVVFGDSLSDNGNLYAGTGLLGFLRLPRPCTRRASIRTVRTRYPSTTGPLGLWIEQLAPKMSLPVPQPYQKGGTNYAVASALTGTNPAFPPPYPACRG